MDVLARRRPARRVSLTPLIDVVFILLVFFMLQTNFLRPASMDLGMPGESGGAGGGPVPINIELHEDGSLWLDGRRIETRELAAALQAANPKPDTRVVFATDREVKLQSVVRVLDILHARQLHRVSLIEARRFE